MAPKPEIREVGSVQSREEMRREVQQHVDQQLREKYGDSWFGRLFASIERDSMVNDQVRNEMDMNASILSQGMTVRQAPPIPVMNYENVSHQELKDKVEEQADPGEVARVGDAWVGVGKWMIDFQRDFSSAIAASKSEWRGVAGDQARQFMAGVGNYIGQAGTSAQLAGTQAGLHSDALARVRAMPDPIDFDVAKANAELGNITDPLERSIKYAEHMAAYQASENARKEAARMAAGFDQSISGSSTMPAFSAPPVMGSGGTGTPEPPRTPQPRNPGGGGRDTSGGSGDRGGSVSPSSGFGGPGPVSRSGALPVIPGPANVAPELVGRTPVQGEGALPPATGGNHVAPGFGPQGGNQNLDPMGGMPMGGFAGGGGDVERGGRGGSFAGGRGFGPVGGPGVGGGPRAGVGGLAAERAAGGRGVAGAGAGRAGAAGMGGMGAGRAQGGEDTEHERPSFLVEPDPDATFGTDEMTAPPVIGA
jgi:hypothetical protein